MLIPEVQTQSRHAPALLLSELYPPAVGGTPVLFEEIYSRLAADVLVLTDRAHADARGRRSAPRVTVVGRSLATRHYVEGFGMVFLEAAATARPSIGGRRGGVAEAVVDGETGLLVGGTDPDELAAAIRTLARDPQRRRAMGQAGRARVARSFTWEQAAAAVSAIHAEVAGWA